METKGLFERKAEIHNEFNQLKAKLKSENRQKFTNKELAQFNKLEEELESVVSMIRAIEMKNGVSTEGPSAFSPNMKTGFQSFYKEFGNQLKSIEKGGISGFETRAITTTTGASLLDERVSNNVVLQSLANDAFFGDVTIIPTSGVPGVTTAVVGRGNYPTASGRANETTAIATTTTTFTGKTLGKKDQFIYQIISNNLIRDGIPSSFQAIFEATTKAMRDKLAYMILDGDSTVNGEFDGISNYAGVQTVAAGGALTSYAKIIDAYKVLMQKNVSPEKIKAVMSPAVWAQLAALQATDNQYIKMPGQVEDLPVIISSQVADDKGAGSDESTIYIGDWSKVQLGLSENLTVRLNERHMDTDSTGLVAILRSDMALFDPAAFCMITGITVS